jgi:hypothetical protein
MTMTLPELQAPPPALAGPVDLTPEQARVLLMPINPNRVQHLKGNAHLEAWDVRRWLNRIFGFGGWTLDTTELAVVREVQLPTDDPKKPRWTVIYRAQARLTVRTADGRTVAWFEDAAMGDSQNQPQLGQAHDQAMKTALSQALKRCAVNLGDQFGLSLYNDGSTEPVVVRSVPMRTTDESAPEAALPEDAPVRPEPGTAAAEQDAPQLQSQQPGPDAWQSAAPAAERQQATAQGAGGMDPDGPTGVGGYVAPLAPPQDAPQQPDADLSPQATQLLADAREATSPAASSRVRWVAERAGAPAGFLAWLDRIAAEKWSAAEDGNDPATGDGTEPPIYTGPAGGSGPALRSPAEAAEERLRIAASRARLTTVDDDFYAVYGLPIGDATAQQLNAFADRIEAAGGQQ